MTREEAWEHWISERPECVQRLAREFPIGIAFAMDGVTYYLTGYNESDMLIVSKINPREAYDAALASTEYITRRLCAEGDANVTPPAKRVEVQFVIERACPHSRMNSQYISEVAAAAPFAIRVYWPPEPNKSHPCKEYTRVFRVSPAGHMEALHIFKRPIMPDVCLCGHMGHVIE